MKKKNEVFRALSMVSQIGITMMVPVFLGAFAGFQIDRVTGHNIWFLIFIFLGIIAGFRNVYYLTKSFYEKTTTDKTQDTEYLRILKERKDKEKHVSKNK